MKKELQAFKKKHGLCNGDLKCDCKKELIKYVKKEIKEWVEYLKMLNES